MFSINKISNILIAEKDSYFSWIPVFFGIGIIIYFKLPFEPDIKFSTASTLLLIGGAFTFKNIKNFFWLLVILSIISSGFLCANIRTMLVKDPTITKETSVKRVTGTIETISERKQGKRFVITNLTIGGINKRHC